MSFKEIKPEELQKNPFQMIGKEWLLVTAEKDGKANTMTASWGGVGVMWGRNVAFIVIRPQRYTKEFIDASDKLSLSVLDEEYRKTLSYLGSVSGRDEDKIGKSGLTVAHTDDVPYFAEANTVTQAKNSMHRNTDQNALSIHLLTKNGILRKIIIPCTFWRLKKYWSVNKTFVQSCIIVHRKSDRFRL